MSQPVSCRRLLRLMGTSLPPPLNMQHQRPYHLRRRQRPVKKLTPLRSCSRSVPPSLAYVTPLFSLLI